MDSTWRVPGVRPQLELRESHVWCVNIESLGDGPDRYWKVLGSAERTRAEHFRFEKNRRLFVTAHGVLRLLLGEYLERDPRALRFEENEKGKPRLSDSPHSDRLEFNLSHSGARVLLAFARRSWVGVDVEKQRKDTKLHELAERFFSKAEAEKLRALPSVEQHSSFFALWTRKEAYLKARGEGIAERLSQFDIAFAPEEPSQLLEDRADGEAVQKWRIHDLDVGPGYRAAVALEHSVCSLHCWAWGPG